MSSSDISSCGKELPSLSSPCSEHCATPRLNESRPGEREGGNIKGGWGVGEVYCDILL